VIDVASYTAATCTQAPTTTTNPGTCGADATTTTDTAGFTACKVWSTDVTLDAGGGVLTVVMAADKITSITVKTTGTENWKPGSTITLAKADLGYDITPNKACASKGPANNIVVTLAEADLDLCIKSCTAKTWMNIASTTGGVGTAATFDVELDADGVKSVMVNTRGTGYAVGDVVTIDRALVGATAIAKGCYAFTAAAEVFSGVAFGGVAGKECEAAPVADDKCMAYTGTGLSMLTGATTGQTGTFTKGFSGGITKCTQLAAKVGIIASSQTGTSAGATFDFVFSEAKLTKVTVNAVGAGVKVGDVFTFTKALLGFTADATGPTGSYVLTVTRAMLEGVSGPDAHLTYTLTKADLVCAIPFGDATTMPIRSQYSSGNYVAYSPVAADFPLQQLAFSVINPAGFAGARKITVSIDNQGSSQPAISSDSAGHHFSGVVAVTDLHITDAGASTFPTERDINIKFKLNLLAGSIADVEKGSVFQIDGPGLAVGSASTSAEGTNLVLTGTSASLFTAKLVAVCTPTPSTKILLTTAAKILPGAKATIDLSFTLTAVGYGRSGAAISISGVGAVDTKDANGQIIDSPKDYTVAETAFPAAETLKVLATSTGAVEALAPTRVVKGKATVTLSGVTAGVESGLTSGATCASLAMGTGASNSQTTGNKALATTIPFAVSGLDAGSYSACIIRSGDTCSTAGDFATARKSAASLTIVSPKLTTTGAQQSTASKIMVGSALIGDIIRFSTSGCTGTDDVTVTTDGEVMTGANLNAGKVIACFATKEDPTAFTNIGEITVTEKSIVIKYVLTLKKADGSEVTLAEISSAPWYAKWEKEITAQFATEVGLAAGSVVIESITQGSLIINFKVYGSDAELAVVETKMKDTTVLNKLATEFAEDAATLDPTNTGYTGTGTASNTKPPVAPPTTTGKTTGTTTGKTTGTVVVAAGASVGPTALIAMAMAALMLKIN